MKFGAHVSIAGSLLKAFERAEEQGCETMQIFSRNPRGWGFKDLDPETAAEFRSLSSSSGISPVVIHMPYLPNLAAGDEEKHKISTSQLTTELLRADALNCPFIVTHIGKALGLPNDAALKQVTKAVNNAIRESGTETPMLLLENTAGQGTEVGNTIDELAAIIAKSDSPDRIGICLDTCHAHAAGYDLAAENGFELLLDEIEEKIGIEKLKVMHLNDSKGACGSRLDRHNHIGQGTIGLDGFRRIVNAPRIQGVSGILETPENDDGNALSNLKTLRSLIE